MAAAFVQATPGTNGSGPTNTSVTTTAFGASTATGNAILVSVYWDTTATSTLTSVTDSKGNSYTKIGSVFIDANANACQHAYCSNITGGASHTVTANFPAASSFIRIVAHEVSGLLTTAAFDKDSGGNSVTATSGAATSVTPSTDGQYIFASCINAGGTASDPLSAGSGFTEPANSTAQPLSNESMAEYQVQTTATAVAAGFTRPSSGMMSMRTSTYKPVGAAAAAPVPPLLIPISMLVAKFKPWFRQPLFNFDLPPQGPTFYVMPADVGTITLAGQVADTDFDRVTAGGQGTLTLAGQDAALRVARRTAGGLGTLTLAGQTAALRSARTMPAGLGTLTLSGQIAVTRFDHRVIAGQGTLTLAGQTAGLRAIRTMPAGQGTLTLSGQAVVTRYGHVTAGGLGTLTLAGQTATLKRSYVMPAGLGTLTLSGQTVNLIYSGAGSKSMPAGTGTLTLAGQIAVLRTAHKAIAGTGTLTLSGQTVALRASHIPLAAGQGTLTLSGQTATLKRGYATLAGQGTLTLSGQAVVTRYGHATLAGLGTLTLSGQTVALKRGYTALAGLGTLALSGPVVNLIYSGAGSKTLPAGVGVLTLSGQNVITRYNRKGIAGQGTLTLAGQAATPRVGMPAGQGTLTLSGQTATLRYAHRMIAGTGTLTLSGQTAALVRGRFLPAGFGTLTLSGQAVGVRFGHRLVVTQGNIVLAGQDAALIPRFRQAYVLAAGTGVLALSGNRANLVKTSQPGIFTFGRRVIIPNRW